jgi:uncharacterized protein with GYD domain
MPTYALLTRLSPDALTHPDKVNDLNEQVVSRIKKECPEVTWKANYAVLGPYDYLDIFEAPDTDTATKVCLIIRSFGQATTETWVITPWDRFKGLVSDLADVARTARR